MSNPNTSSDRLRAGVWIAAALAIGAAGIALVDRIPVDRRTDSPEPADTLGIPGPQTPAPGGDPESLVPAPGSVAVLDIAATTMELNDPTSSIQQDLGIVHGLIEDYRRTSGGNPVGLNEDITAQLAGRNPKKAAWLPPDHPAIDRPSGQLFDRWGSAFYFHPLSANEMEIRSPGPDKELFTDDDVVYE